MRKANHEEQVHPLAADVDERFYHCLQSAVLIALPKRFPYIDIVGFGRYLDIKGLDAVRDFFKKISGWRAEELYADFVLDRVLLHGSEEPIAVVLSGLEQVAEHHD